MYRYYLLRRPPAPGAIPGGAATVKSFDSRQHVIWIGRPAWGWAEYSGPLEEYQMDAYELAVCSICGGEGGEHVIRPSDGATGWLPCRCRD